MRVGGSEVESSSSVTSRRMDTRYSVSEMSGCGQWIDLGDGWMVRESKTNR